VQAPRLGQDIVSIARLQAAVERHEAGFRRRVYTAAEWDACAARADRYAALASRFAAKEAALKALGTGFGLGAALREVEVVGGGRTAPRLVLSGRALERARTLGVALDVSLSHDGDLAVALVAAWPTTPPS
jgi:holo-[acyl-carrier protein] synthase